MPEIIRSVNLDAGESAFFARELEHVKARTYDVEYPEYVAQQWLPVDSSAGPGAEAIVYRQFDSVGVMRLIANYADDLPRCDVKGKEFTVTIKPFGNSYGYNIQEIRNARHTGRPLNQRKANACRTAYEQLVERIAWLADGSAKYGGLLGLLYNPNITKGAAPNGGWLTGATADQIIEDVNKLINNVRSLTKKVEAVDTVLLPVDHYSYIASTPRSNVSDTTILEFLKRVHPNVTFESLNELAAMNPAPSGGAAPTNVAVAYRKSADKMTLEIPQPFEQFNAQERGLEFVVPCHARIAGVIIYYPLSVNLFEGL